MRYSTIAVFMLIVVMLIFIPTECFASTNLQIHRVESGDTLNQIAETYETDIAEITELNPISDIDYLEIGQVLVVPGLLTEVYQVLEGDTLTRIAHEYEVELEVLGELNDLQDLDMIYAGKKLEIPVIHTSREQGYQGGFNFADNTDGLFFRGNPNEDTENHDSKKQIALTFDDGPDKHYTPEILNVLDEFQIPATFYFVGERVEKYSEVVARTFQEGHEIGNHSLSHPDFRLLEKDALRSEIKETEELIYNEIGVKTAQLRPPYGALNEQNKSVIADQDYHVVNWSVDTWDWLDKHPDLFHINSLPYLRDGSIVLMHSSAGKEGDSRAHLLQALPEMIRTLKSQGYEFVSVSELIDKKAYK